MSLIGTIKFYHSRFHSSFRLLCSNNLMLDYYNSNFMLFTSDNDNTKFSIQPLLVTNTTILQPSGKQTVLPSKIVLHE